MNRKAAQSGHTELANLDTMRKGLIRMLSENSPVYTIAERAYRTACDTAGIDADTWEGNQ